MTSELGAGDLCLRLRLGTPRLLRLRLGRCRDKRGEKADNDKDDE